MTEKIVSIVWTKVENLEQNREKEIDKNGLPVMLLQWFVR